MKSLNAEFLYRTCLFVLNTIQLLQVSTDNSDGRFKFLENAKDLPTISKCDKTST